MLAFSSSDLIPSFSRPIRASWAIRRASKLGGMRSAAGPVDGSVAKTGLQDAQQSMTRGNVKLRIRDLLFLRDHRLAASPRIVHGNWAVLCVCSQKRIAPPRTVQRLA